MSKAKEECNAVLGRWEVANLLKQCGLEVPVNGLLEGAIKSGRVLFGSVIGATGVGSIDIGVSDAVIIN